MEIIRLGKTDLQISRIGFGGIPIQKNNEEASLALIRSLVEHGINYIDTAKAYTVSEELIGNAMEQLGVRDRFVLATKSMARDKEGMARDIASSLEKLKTDYIELYQVHNPTLDQLKAVCLEGGALEALMEARAAGKVGHIGVTVHSLAVFEYALTLDWVETIMFPYNIVETQGEHLIEACREKDIGFIAMKPLAGGAIEDATLAVRFVCANPFVDVVIPGMYCEAEVQQNVDAVMDKTALNSEEMDKIAKIREELGTNFCRRCNYCAPCAAGISIPSVFLFGGYLERYGLEKWARERYATLAVKASACIDCGACESRCPYELPIRDMLKKYATAFGE
ncbi:MAG: aldo/keto reductase [Clostridia bacterium]|nr:aldo/keto reductase [Clostridia bacterium]